MEKQLVDIKNQTISLSYMHDLVKLTERYPHRTSDIWDSVGKNQFISKTELLNVLFSSGVINKDLDVTIVGSWYGTILIPVLAPLVKSISCIDIDEETTHIATNIFDFDNVRYIKENPFDKNFGCFRNPDNVLIINTSCEHMGSLKDLFNMQRLPAPEQKNVWFALQSNNMFGIEGHINCKHGIDEFKEDLPWNHELISEREIEEERGTRFFLFGRLNPLPRTPREENNE